MSDKNDFDELFFTLAKEVGEVLERNKDGSDQRKQVERLLAAEKAFIREIWKYPLISTEIYKKFILHIVVTNKNILTAQPYFREKADIFNTKISPAIKDGKARKLRYFAVNFKFLKFVKDNWPGRLPEKVEKYYDQADRARTILIENNIPIAINRAKIFYKKAPESHLSLNDIINIAIIGLINGIDKWSGEYNRVFMGLCIGNMSGMMIEHQSETSMYFYPSDKTVLYRANSFRHKYKIEDIKLLAELVTKSFKDQNKQIDPAYLGELFNAAYPISGDAHVVNSKGEESKKTIFDTYKSEDSEEEKIIMKDFMTKLLSKAGTLSPIEKKILKLKGVKL